MTDHIEVVIITGMSGAGKTVAMQSFEDMGYYCIDNMPPELLPKFWEITRKSGQFDKIALVMDLRMRDFFTQMKASLDQIEDTPFIVKRIVFLDCDDKELINRYKESRRSHPLAYNRRTIEGIKKERELLSRIRNQAQVVIDTSDLTPRELREKLIKLFKESSANKMFRVEMVSFGFKHGLPMDADIVMDVRFLPNPHYIPELKNQTGLDEPVYDYVMQQPETEAFYNKFIDLLTYNLPGYKKEGKTNLTVAIGCTGGQHRSVALTERVGKKLIADGYNVNISHRDKDKKKESTVRS
ncbi:MAG TPA: RNase adapter RapZ [Alloiococcus sp.]|nr:RNase adapter RapZ [Alloiococcus sp.]